MSVLRPLFAVSLALFVMAFAAGPASAEDAAPAPLAAEPPVPPTPPTTTAAPAVAGEASYHSPMRTSCEDELAKDQDWFTNLKDRLAVALHADHQKYELALKQYEAAKAQGGKPTPPRSPAWFADLTERMNREVHASAANYATKNNKHVVYAYAAFWLLTVAFVIVMWRRQRALQAELTRLEGALARAVKEGGAA